MYGSILYKLLGSFNATSGANPVYTFDSARKIQITMLPVRYSPVSTVQNHNRQCQESKTCHPILKFPLTYTRRDVDQTPKAPKCSGDQPQEQPVPEPMQRLMYTELIIPYYFRPPFFTFTLFLLFIQVTVKPDLEEKYKRTQINNKC